MATHVTFAILEGLQTAMQREKWLKLFCQYQTPSARFGERADEIVEEVRQTVEDALEFAAAQPPPQPEDGLLNVFAQGAVPAVDRGRATLKIMTTKLHSPFAFLAALALVAAISRAPAQPGPGYALSFDGTNDCVVVPHSNALNPYPLTITVWIKTTQSSGPPGLVNKYVSNSGNGYQLYLLNGNVRAWYFRDLTNRVFTGGSDGMNGGFVADGQWHHLAFAVDGAGGRLYVDGTLKASLGWTGTPGPTTTTQELSFAKYPGESSAWHFNGLLDEVALWNIGLTNLEIQAIMHVPLYGTEPGLLGCWRFNEGAGLTVADAATHGFAGTLVNGPLWVVSTAPIWPGPPFVTTLSASNITWNSATLQGTVNPLRSETSAWFEWGATTNYGNSIGLTNLGSGTNTLPISSVLTDLTVGATYQFRVVATNAQGTSAGTSQSFTTPIFTDIGAGLPGVYYGAAAWGDCDNDGDLDILLTGATSPTHLTDPIARVYRNNGDNSFTALNIDLPGVSGTSMDRSDRPVAWGDFDSDGDLDIALTGHSTNLVAISRICRNNGDGTFTELNAGLPGVAAGSVAWGDCDNDGKLDFLLTGTTNSGASGAISRVYRNCGEGRFTDPDVGLPGLLRGSVAWGDFDDDGDMDILLAGCSSSSVPISRIYQNHGDGLFTDLNAGLPAGSSGTLAQFCAAWGDYDNDGDLDIALTGQEGSTSVSRIYRNDGGVFTNINAGLPVMGAGSLAWGDYDNDGDLDLLLSRSAAPPVYRNNGDGTFSGLDLGLAGVGYAYASWGDYDNDGDLDVLVTGNGLARVYQNNSPVSNTPPAPPTGLRAEATGGRVTLRWNAATDTQTPAAALTYNVRVGTVPGGCDIVSPQAGTNGFRRLPAMGNGQLGARFRLNVALDRPLYWSVQAVDSAFAGSAFAPEASFRLYVLVSSTAGLVPGDFNGDEVVDPDELNSVLTNYWPTSPWLYLTNAAGPGGTNVTFALPSSTAGAYSVLVSTNLADWEYLGPATPRYEFTDTNVPAIAPRYYRLRWP